MVENFVKLLQASWTVFVLRLIYAQNLRVYQKILNSFKRKIDMKEIFLQI